METDKKKRVNDITKFRKQEKKSQPAFVSRGGSARRQGDREANCFSQQSARKQKNWEGQFLPKVMVQGPKSGVI